MNGGTWRCPNGDGAISDMVGWVIYGLLVIEMVVDFSLGWIISRDDDI